MIETMTGAELRKNVFRVAWPATLESIFQMAVGIVNTAMVGSLGAVAIAAVGLSNRIVMTGWALFQAVGTGATVLIAQMFGAGDLSHVKSVARQAVVAATLISSALAALCFVFAEPFLAALGADPDVLMAGAAYMPLLGLSLPFQAVTQAAGAALRGAGDTRSPMQVAFLVNVVNVVGNIVLIFGRCGFPALGINGSAIATITAQAIGSVVALLVLTHPRSKVGVRLKGPWKPEPPHIKRILGVGLPAAGESIFWQAASIVLTSLIASFGTIALAAHQLGLQAESISYMPSTGFSIAAVTLVGHSIGAKNTDLARRYVKEISLWSVLLMGFTGSIMFFMPYQLMRMLTSDTDVIVLGIKYLMLMAITQIPMQMASVLGGAMRGAGDTKTPMLVAAFGVWAIRIPLAFLLSRNFGLGIVGVWVGMTIDLFVRFGLSIIVYLRSALHRSASISPGVERNHEAQA